jgi:hypothetical protein
MTALILDSNNELVIQHGTLALGDTRDQNASLIVLAEKGEFKEHPQLGVGISQFLKSVNREKELQRAIRVQLALDGIRPKEIEYQNGKLHIEL